MPHVISSLEDQKGRAAVSQSAADWLPKWLSGKEFICQGRRCGSHPWVGKIPWRGKWQPTPVFLPGEFHGQRGLAGYI